MYVQNPRRSSDKNYLLCNGSLPTMLVVDKANFIIIYQNHHHQYAAKRKKNYDDR